MILTISEAAKTILSLESVIQDNDRIIDRLYAQINDLQERRLTLRETNVKLLNELRRLKEPVLIALYTGR